MAKRTRLGQRRMWPNTPHSLHETTCRTCGAQFTTDTIRDTCPACRRKYHKKRKR